jgi:hypothetical protein
MKYGRQLILNDRLPFLLEAKTDKGAAKLGWDGHVLLAIRRLKLTQQRAYITGERRACGLILPCS